jgi:hypothetical protein
MLKCINSEPGTYNHECGKPAQWQATKPSGYTSHFCTNCKKDGTEARAYAIWNPLTKQGENHA